MNETKTEQTDCFKVKDVAGKEYLVNEFTECRDASTFVSPNVWETVSKSYKLENGRELERLGGGDFSYTDARILLRRIK